MTTRLKPIYTVILDADAERHPHTTFRSTEEAFGPSLNDRVLAAIPGRRFRRASKAPQILRGVGTAVVISLALVGLLTILRANPDPQSARPATLGQ